MQPKNEELQQPVRTKQCTNQIQRTFELQYTVDLASTAAWNHRLIA